MQNQQNNQNYADETRTNNVYYLCISISFQLKDTFIQK